MRTLERKRDELCRRMTDPKDALAIWNLVDMAQTRAVKSSVKNVIINEVWIEGMGRMRCKKRLLDGHYGIVRIDAPKEKS